MLCSILEAGAVLQVASGTTVDPVLEAVAASYEAAATCIDAAPVLLSSGLDNLADFVVGIVLETVALEVEVYPVRLEMSAVNLVVSSVEMEDLAAHLETAVMDLVGAVTVESEVAAVGDVPNILEVVAIFNGPTVVFGMISALESFPVGSGCKRVVFVPLVDPCRLDVSSLALETVRQELALSADLDTLIWVILTSSFDSGRTSEVVSVITHRSAVVEDGCASGSSESLISISTTFEMKQLYLVDYSFFNCQRATQQQSLLGLKRFQEKLK